MGLIVLLVAIVHRMEQQVRPCAIKNAIDCLTRLYSPSPCATPAPIVGVHRMKQQVRPCAIDDASIYVIFLYSPLPHAPPSTSWFALPPIVKVHRMEQQVKPGDQKYQRACDIFCANLRRQLLVPSCFLWLSCRQGIRC